VSNGVYKKRQHSLRYTKLETQISVPYDDCNNKTQSVKYRSVSYVFYSTRNLRSRSMWLIVFMTHNNTKFAIYRFMFYGVQNTL
jgi:hypothetical protein